jgi:hypothetical protein
MLIGRVGLALFGGMGSPGFGRVRLMPRDGWMRVRGSRDGGRANQGNRDHP